ncbi:MAG: septation regulator SpoVG [Lachnospiraceae bacterium]|nr:septation regulator SpoVG [Lachnospiraceae bacterium]
MKITDVRIRRMYGAGSMKGVASITLDDEFVVHDIKIIENEQGLFISMPSRRGGDGTFRDVAHPLTNKARTEIQEVILGKFKDNK